jgi:large subunit ribosomal protein L35
MPKTKTNKALRKRVKVTARGKIRRHRVGAGHLKSSKSPRRLRRLRQETDVPEAFARHVRQLLGR